MKKALIFLALLNSTADAAGAAPQQGAGTGSERTVSEAYTLLSSDRFPNPTPNEKLTYLQGITKLAGIAHPADFSKVSPKANPTLSQIKMDPMRLLSQAEAEYRKGDARKGAYLTLRVVQICSECHATGQKPVWSSLAPTARLSQLEWGEFLRLSRRNDDALLYYEKVLNTPNIAASQPAVWEKAALNIVALGIESSSNAYTFVDLISNSLASVQLPKRERALLTSWRVTGKAWGAEPSAVIKPFEMLTQARQLWTNGEQMNHTQANSGFVNQARAMLVLKKVMEKGGAEQKARAFLMAGEFREKLPIDGAWLHPEDYYEACGRVMPKGSDAMKCYSAIQTLPQRNAKYIPDTAVLRALQPGGK